MEQLSNRYRLLEMIGQGGMAKVYKAEDEVLGRIVAVKVLREQYANDQSFLGRFLQEARSAASLSHPNIVNVFDVGDDKGQYYIVMELVDGASLKDLIQQEAPFTVERAVNIARQICSGLQAAHSQNIVHRDIKPQNVLVTRLGQVKIADFGIARALGEASFSETGQVFGSVHYLSPEQAQGKRATTASDVYALGVVCYEMLTGRLPFDGETVVGVALRHIQEVPQPLHELNPSVPTGLESMVLRALAKAPEERYQSAGEMGQALQQFSQLGQQTTGLFSAVGGTTARSVTDKTTRVKPVRVSSQTTASPRPANSGGNFLLFILTILAIISVLGLCALSAAVYQAYNTKFAGVLPSFYLPTATATAVLVAVPNVEGKTASEAESLIVARDLKYAEGPPEMNDKVPAGHVIRQSLQPGISVTLGSEVRVVLSKKPDNTDVPFVIGSKVDDAETVLRSKGFVVTKREQSTKALAPGVVIDQEPKPGYMAPVGSTVILQVAKAVEKIAVPDVIGKPEDEAKKIIEDAGLVNSPWTDHQSRSKIPESLLPFFESIPVGHVVSTTPKAGTVVDPGTEILMGVRKD